MPTKDSLKNRQYVAKSRAKLIASIGIEEYRKRNAEAQRAYRAKKRAIKKAIMSNIDNRLDVNDPTEYRQKFRSSRMKK
jgi:uncharacterized protein YpiB (UPF0302 family)